MAIQKYIGGSPTASEMKEFAGRFSKEEWEKLCSVQKFLDIFSVDIKACRLLAEKILASQQV